jgi:glycosyltransferase involved in cell wall biosynthesis
MKMGANVRLVIQVPCLNEEATLGLVLAAIPDKIEGVDTIDVLVVDDGSTDRTCEVAGKFRNVRCISNGYNRGLARGFQRGIDEGLRRGADIIVNIDGDNQYDPRSIPDLIAPILSGAAGIVIGDRRPGENAEFSASKRFLQRFGSWTVRRMSNLDVPDAVSGFRAYSREAALSINVLTTFSYTVETLIHAGQNGFRVASVPVRTNRTERPSRLFKSIPSFIGRQLATIVRSALMYRSLTVFFTLGAILLVIGLIPIARFLYFFAIGEGDGHIQSLVLGGVLILAGYLTLVLAGLSEVVATNRRLLEQMFARIKDMDDRSNHDPN